MFLVTAFLLQKWGPFAHHLAVKGCRVCLRPGEKPSPSAGARVSLSWTKHLLALSSQMEVPWDPQRAAPASGGLWELPHAAENGTHVVPSHATLAGHSGAGALPGREGLAADSHLLPALRGTRAEPPTRGAATISTANTAFVPDTSKCSLMNHLDLQSTAQQLKCISPFIPSLPRACPAGC